jgi:WhiB family redox-sensing transcriptional regulator
MSTSYTPSRRSRSLTALNLPPRVCEGCGELYRPRTGELLREYGRRRYCNRSCASRHATPRTGKPPRTTTRRNAHRDSGAIRLAADPAELAWREHGACRQVSDPDVFYPHSQGNGAAAHVAEAKWWCSICPVTPQCLAWALKHDEDGVWGGTTEAERAEMKKLAPTN